METVLEPVAVAVPVVNAEGSLGRRKAFGLAAGLAMACSAALYTLFARFGIARGLASPDITFIRFLVAGVVCLPILVRGFQADRGGLMTKWRLWIALAVLAGPPFGMVMFSALTFAPANHAAVFPFASISVLGTLLSAYFLADRLTGSKIAGILVVIFGLAFASGIFSSALTARALIGDALFVTAGAMWAGFGVVMRKFRLDPLLATAVISLLSILTYVPLYLVLVGGERLLQATPSLLVIEAVAQGLIGGIGTLYFYAKAGQLLGAARAAIFPALAPGLASLFGWPLLGHVPDIYEGIGVALVVGGLVLTVISTSPLSAAQGASSSR